MQKQKLLILVVLLILVSGCASKQNQVSTDQSSSANKIQRPMKIENENLLLASPSDLAVGKKALIFGTVNSDGAVSANQIIISDNDTDFEQFNAKMKRPEDTNTETKQIPSQTSNQGQFRQRQNAGQFQNMSEEERAKLREQRTGGVQNGGQRQFGGGQNKVSRSRGEIISKDDNSITLKLDDGGSKLIFFSTKTTINTIKEVVKNTTQPEIVQ